MQLTLAVLELHTVFPL